MKRLSALSWILKDSSISIDRAILSSYTPENFQNECRRILELLQERSCFSTARAVAELAELPVDNVIVQEVLGGQWALCRASCLCVRWVDHILSLLVAE